MNDKNTLIKLVRREERYRSESRSREDEEEEEDSAAGDVVMEDINQ